MKVLLIDDHPLILSALKTVIQGLGDDLEVVGVHSAAEARATLALDPEFDLALLDLQLGDANGFDLLAELRSAYPALPVVIVSASDRASDVIRSIDLGAMGFVPKRSSTEILFEALRLVMSGGIYVPQMAMGLAGAAAVAAAQARPLREEPEALRTVGREALQSGYQSTPSSLATLGLTPRQTDVLALLLQGKPNKLIARELGLSVETVKDHVAAVLRALGVNTRTQAVLAVSQMTQGSASPGWRRSGQ